MRQGTKALIGAVALIGIGFTAGVAVDRLWWTHHPQSVSSTEARDRMLDDLQSSVGLTQVQMQRVHEILQRHQQVIAGSWYQLQPQVRATIESVRTQIHGVLDSAQAEAFERWFVRAHQIRHHEAHP